MKQTDFRFELQVAPEDPQGTLGGLKGKLLNLKGINSVSASGTESVVELTLNASFEDAEQAKKLHRKASGIVREHSGRSRPMNLTSTS